MANAYPNFRYYAPFFFSIGECFVQKNSTPCLYCSPFFSVLFDAGQYFTFITEHYLWKNRSVLTKEK